MFLNLSIRSISNEKSIFQKQPLVNVPQSYVKNSNPFCLFCIRKVISGKSFSFSSVSIKEIVKRIKTLGKTKASKSNDTPIKIPQ